MIKLLAILLVVFVAVKAYDFTDLDYNQYLLDEFESLHEDVVDSRQRRDTETMPAGDKKQCAGRHGGEGKRNFICCTGDKFNTERFKVIKETKKQCAMKLRANNSDVENFDAFDCEKMGRIKQLIICEGECFAKTMNILDESGKLNREIIIQHFSENLDSEWKEASLESYVDKCLAKVEASEHSANQKCSSAPMAFHHCLWGAFINGCPADLRIDSPKCNKMRERHGQGSFLKKKLLNDFLHHGRAHKGPGSAEKSM